jgi:hypothetical protein
MKKLLRGIKSSVDRKVDNWLHKEERQAHEQQLEETMAKVEEVMKPVKEFIDATLMEDLDTKPTGRDIDRYFHIYNGAMEGKKKLMEHIGVWTQDADDPILTAEEYEEKAQADGWKFLRESVGLPLCDLNKKRPDAWRTPPAKPHSVPQAEAWDAEEKTAE